MKKTERVREIIARLKTEYPIAECSLNYDEAWKLLVSVRLAAQCTDARVNEIMPLLLQKYPTPKALADAPVDKIEEIIRPCGLSNGKSRDIKGCMTMLVYTFDARVPDTMEELLKLPGVGRKSANLILGDVYKKPAVVTDTHCIRLSNRLGLVRNCKDPVKVERELWKIIPKEEANDLCHRFVMHGREVCTARTTPYCKNCVLEDICPKHIEK